VKTPNRKARIAQLITEMNSGLLERREQVNLIMLAALAGEHVLLLGPPGTAKSELAKRLKNVFVEANYFERLLTRFSVPEEVFGPLSIQALEEDNYKRLTRGYLPEASVAFIDEIFKANSAILNSLLTLLNERQFDNGNRRYSVPLISVVAASNELPDGEELDALYDRFMLRSFVHPVTDGSFSNLLTLEKQYFDPDKSIRLKNEDLEQVQALAEKVELTSDVIELCNEFRKYLQQENIYVSDRRWRKLVKLMKVSAFTSGFSKVSNYDAWILPHCLWQKPEQLSGLQGVYRESISISGDMSSPNISALLCALENKFKVEKEGRIQKVDDNGKPLFKDFDRWTTTEPVGKQQKKNKDGDYLYIDHHGDEVTEKESYRGANEPVMVDGPNEPITESIFYSISHIQQRVNEISSIRNSLSDHIDRLENQLSRVDQIFSEHLWIDPTLKPEVITNITAAKEHTESLLQRADALVEGFKNLPQESDVLDSLPLNDSEVEDADGGALEGEIVD
jgi:MoxR-like ATPase